MHALEEFNDIVRAEEPLAPHTYLKVGGPAEFLVQPRSVQELTAVMQRCAQKNPANNGPHPRPLRLPPSQFDQAQGCPDGREGIERIDVGATRLGPERD